MLHIMASLAALLGGEGDPPRSEVDRPPSPAEALREIRADAGLRVELAAAEPGIESPVAMTFSEDGRLWVVEMRDYPEGPPEGSAPGGRIRALEDRDGDGFHEESAVFADGLLHANGLQRWRRGFVVTAAPEILYLEDADGDGRAERREVIYEGFSTDNSQLLVSFPTLGIDNWIYAANGLRGGEARRSGAADARPVPLAGKDFRFDPLREREEAVSGMGQFGLAFDAWGRRFVCDNRHHLRHVVIESRYLERNPHLASAEALQDTSVLDPGSGWAGSPIHPISRHWTNYASHSGRFTAACGIFVYEGDLLPEPYRGAVLTCDPTANLVHAETLRPDGATFRSRPLREGVEILASRDDWFRPVSLADGPDGALYVVDMCRATVEHPAWLAESVRGRFDYRAGKDRGRIWRVVPREGAPRKERPRLGSATAAELVGLLSHAGSWWRRTAHRILLERGDESARLLLGGVAGASSEPLARLHAAWLLHALGGIDTRHVSRLLADAHPRVRQAALLLAEPLLERADILERALRLADDPDPAVRFQTALSLGELDGEGILPALARIAASGADDRWTRLAVATAVPRRAGSLLRILLGPPARTDRASPGRLALIRELAAAAGARGDPEDIAAAAGALSALGESEAASQAAGLAGLADGLARGGRRLRDIAPPGAAPETGGGKIRTMLSRAALWARDARADEASRRDAIRLLGHAPWEEARPALAEILREAGDGLRAEAARALGMHGSPEAFSILLDGWSRQGAAVRREAAGALLASREGTLFLLEAVEDGRVPAVELGAARIARLLADGREDVKARARKVLGGGVPEERRLVIERYRAALGREEADVARGRVVFEKHCASCHRVGGLGVAVGPDISDVQAKDPEALLADILDPGRAIDGSYVQQAVTLEDGTVVTGLLQAETGSSLTLRRAEGETLVIPRSTVVAVRSGEASFMPDGVEKLISVEEMADLITFLRDGRYLDAAPPLLGPARPDAAGAPPAGPDGAPGEE